MREAQLFEATDDLSRLSEVDVVVICVPTPIGKHREPDLSYVIKTTRAIAASFQRGQLIVLEIDNVPRHNDGSCAAYSQINRPQVRSRFLLGIFTGAGRSRKRSVFYVKDP